MEAAYARRPILMGGFESAFVAMVAAAMHPDRFDGLILFGPAPSWRRSADLPWERPDDQLRHELGVIRKATDLRAWVGSYVRELIPSRAGDPRMVSVLQALSALSGTPEAWYSDQRMFNEVDLLDLLPSIRVPTLVLSRPDAGFTGWSDPRSAQVVAERISSAKHVELPGADAPPWYGESEPVVAEIREVRHRVP
jgi:pimeloyl-ACP methyl ester carboxylesterase